ncbi:MAG TPA: hypothetical protein PLQ93_08985 [Bacteroidia bacterium]|nr:hypothetical protein [Bacteroidia bacterium]
MNCKFLLLTILSYLLAFPVALAQRPETIYGKNKVLKPNAYYLQQADLWKLETEKDPKNANAWLNYYRASRNAYVQGEDDDSPETKGQKRFMRLNHIVEDMEKQVPDSYEYNFVKWLNGNNDLNLYPFLEKAHRLSPASPDPIMSLIFYHEIKGQYTERDGYIEAYCKLGDYSPGLLNYGYNLLSGLEKNAIVLTEGDKDTEAMLLLTVGRKHRADVRVLNLNLLLIKTYRDRVFQELQVSAFDFNPLGNADNFRSYQALILRSLAENKKGRPLCAALTVGKAYTAPVQQNLYLTGLAYAYSLGSMNNTVLLKKNLEDLYLLDYIREYFPADISVGNVNDMNGNYLLPFATLSAHYVQAGDTAKANRYKQLAYLVANKSDRLEEFKMYFQEP